MRGHRGLQARHVRFERDGDPVAKTALRAVADDSQKPGGRGRNSQTHAPPPVPEPALCRQQSVGQQLHPQRQQRVRQRGEQRQCEGDGQQPRLGFAAHASMRATWTARRPASERLIDRFHARLIQHTQLGLSFFAEARGLQFEHGLDNGRRPPSVHRACPVPPRVRARARRYGRLGARSKTGARSESW